MIIGKCLRTGFTLMIAVAGGAVFWHLHMPLAWLIGPMIANGLAALLGIPVAVPAQARPPMTAMIGAILGTSFTPSVFNQTGPWLLSLAGLAIFIATSGAMAYAYFRFVAQFDHATAYFSAMPGGLVEMVTLGAERGGDERTIALVHASRIFLVVLTLPFLIQWISGVAVARSGSAITAAGGVSTLEPPSDAVSPQRHLRMCYVSSACQRGPRSYFRLSRWPLLASYRY